MYDGQNSMNHSEPKNDGDMNRLFEPAKFTEHITTTTGGHVPATAPFEFNELCSTAVATETMMAPSGKVDRGHQVLVEGLKAHLNLIVGLLGNI